MRDWPDRYHSFRTYPEFSKKLIFNATWLLMRVYQGGRNVSFSEIFPYVLNEWSHTKLKKFHFAQKEISCKHPLKKSVLLNESKEFRVCIQAKLSRLTEHNWLRKQICNCNICSNLLRTCLCVNFLAMQLWLRKGLLARTWLHGKFWT